MTKSRQPDSGYSLIELLVATVLFTIIAGIIFSLLFSAQLRYSSESGLTTAFQHAMHGGRELWGGSRRVRSDSRDRYGRWQWRSVDTLFVAGNHADARNDEE